MKTSILLPAVSALLFTSVQADWSDTFKSFATLEYWYGADASDDEFDPLRSLGGNGPYYPSPNVHRIDSTPPSGCTVDQAIYVLRHGSRNPDQGAYNGWVDLYYKIANATFTAKSEAAFLPTWKTVLTNPTLQIATESIVGYREIYDLAISLRTQYPSFYATGAAFHVFANEYPRVVETAQNFIRAFIGPKASLGLGTVYAINSTGTGALGNSLAPSDLCPSYVDNSGVNQTNIWDALTLPSALKRLNKLITSGSVNFTTTDVSNMMYLCGFESAITGTPSPFCSLFTNDEFEQYEYHQDLRYWYGNGPGSATGKYMMFPLLNSIAQLMVDFNGNSSSKIQPLTMAFTNDGQMSQLASQIGVFDNEKPLEADNARSDRTYYASHFVSMRGTIAFERLNCPANGGKFVRIKLNDAVHPIPSCKSGPGSSCPVSQYAQYVANKEKTTGGMIKYCGVNTTKTEPVTNFWTQYDTLPYVRSITSNL